MPGDRKGAYTSVLDMFSIGIGPSSSHTVGPMRAALAFRIEIEEEGLFESVTDWQCRLHGSLAATGLGHSTPDAVIAGLRGYDPKTVNPDLVHGVWDQLVRGKSVRVGAANLSASDISFEPLNRDYGHPNALSFIATLKDGTQRQTSFLSVGGGFIRRVGSVEQPNGVSPLSNYRTMAELMASLQGRSIADVAWEDEVHFHGEQGARDGLEQIREAMRGCVHQGLSTRGTLPGPLRVPRRAADAYEVIRRSKRVSTAEESLPIFALAVSEENAAGGRVVTSPTNGAAGVIPALLTYSGEQHPLSEKTFQEFMLTACVIGSLIKENASISGAEAGCQAEVGSACAMAAAGLTAIRGGTPEQVENAAEIAIEHHLGLTCDPVGGLVQIPCIERNAVAASTALTASRLALLGDGTHIVGLDTVIETMRQTGLDMSHHYKETSTAGLAVNVVEC